MLEMVDELRVSISEQIYGYLSYMSTVSIMSVAYLSKIRKSLPQGGIEQMRREMYGIV